MSIDTVKRTFSKLEKMGYLIVGNFNKDPRDKTKWYSINDKKLEELYYEMREKKLNQEREIREEATHNAMPNANSYGLNYQKTGKDLMSQDEITVMDGSKCIFQLRGVRPFLTEKFDITKHKNYKLLEGFDNKNTFNIEDYISRKGKAKLNKNSVITRL